MEPFLEKEEVTTTINAQLVGEFYPAIRLDLTLVDSCYQGRDGVKRGI